MYCPKCGNQIEDGLSTCPFCGSNEIAAAAAGTIGGTTRVIPDGNAPDARVPGAVNAGAQDRADALSGWEELHSTSLTEDADAKWMAENGRTAEDFRQPENGEFFVSDTERPDYISGGGAGDAAEAPDIDVDELLREDAAEEQYEEDDIARRFRRTDPDRMRKSMKRRKTRIIRTLAIIMIAAAAAFIICLFAVLNIGKEIYGPKRAAENYMKAAMVENSSQMYDYLIFDEEAGQSPYLSKTAFINAHASREVPASSGLVLTEQASPDDDTAVYRADYVRNGENVSTTVTLKKTGAKEMYFFDQWKVAAEDLYGTDVQVYVPGGTSFLLNDEVIAPEEGGAGADYTVCRIPYLFYGAYQTELTESGKEDYLKKVDYTGGAEDFDFRDVRMQLTQSVRDSLVKKFASDYQAILSSILNRESFSRVESLFTSNALADGSVRANYEALLNEAYDPARGSGKLRAELREVTAQFLPNSVIESLDKDCVIFQVSFSKDISYTEDNSSIQTSTSNEDFAVSYRKTDAGWRIEFIQNFKL